MDRLATLDEETLSMVFSDLSSLENGTDDFGRRILQHTRDTQRISNVLNSQPQAFRKARPLQRTSPVALTTDNLQRNSNANNALAAAHAALERRISPSVASSAASSDPPLNLPREWGRKGRHDHNWLKRIPRADSKVDDDGTDQNGHVDWLAAAHTPSANEGHNESPYRPSSRKPASQTVPSPPQQDLEWDIDQDLTAASLLASTPALPSRNRPALEDIRRRELEESSMPTSARDTRGLWERTPSETRRRRSRENLRQTEHPQQSPPRDTTTQRASPGRKTTGWNKENDPLVSRRIDNRPSLLDSYKIIESAAAAGPAYPSTSVQDMQTPRLNQKRTDSLALLKLLARASQSPSPNAVKQSDEAALAHTKTPSGAPKHEPRNQSQVSQNHATLQIQTKVQRNTQLGAQTPVVTGAWVDTPRTAKREDFAQPTTMPREKALPSLPRRRSEPNLPTSALSAVLENLRRDKANHTDDDPTLGDSTIASLEGLLYPGRAQGEADPTITLNVPDTLLSPADQYDDDTLDITHPTTTQADRDRRQEDLALEALNNMLGSTKASIHAASQGLKRAVRKVRNPITDSTIFEIPEAAETTTTTTTPLYYGGHTSVFRAAWSEICSLFIGYTRKGKWRLTWLGLASLLFWTWFVTENALCNVYCQPLYAKTMKGYGVDPNAPRYPFVLPTLVFRPFEEIWRPVLGLLASVLGSVWAFMTDDEGVVAPVTAPVLRKMAAATGVREEGNGGLRASGVASKISWFGFGKSKGVAHDDGDVWGKGQLRRMNVWDQGQVAWEAPGEGGLDGESMLDDEFM